jgi:hypothetical protein
MLLSVRLSSQRAEELRNGDLPPRLFWEGRVTVRRQHQLGHAAPSDRTTDERQGFGKKRLWLI